MTSEPVNREHPPRASSSLKRIIIGLVVALVVTAGGYWGYQKLDASKIDFDVSITPDEIPADGVSSALLKIRLLSRFGNELNVRALPYAPTIKITEGRNLVKVIMLGDSLRYRLVSYFNPGTVVVQVSIYGSPGPIEAKLELTPSLADRNNNGYPDAMDLSSESDRTAFRRWFTTIALGQLTHKDDGWQDRDCAGLARYCYRESLKRHDNKWLASRQWLVTGAIPDVRKYNYPNVPLVGTRVFNAGDRAGTSESPGAIAAADSPSRSRSSDRNELSNFSDFAEASRLKDNSIAFLSRSPDEAQPGDLILYLNDTDSEWPYHVMIYLGNGMTIYHTGPDGNDPGILKRLSLAQLGQHQNPRWHPVEANPYFLGFYRWKILV